MKKIMSLISAAALSASAFAMTVEEQKEVLINLEAARAEIRSVESSLPWYLYDELGESLRSAEARLDYAQSIVKETSVVATYYCVVESTFDGYFSGRATTQLEATKLAMETCKTESRNNGFFCKEKSLSCERE